MLPQQSAQTLSLSWAIIEESIKSCFPLSPTFLFFQTGAVPFLWDWSDLLNAKTRLAALPLSLCTPAVVPVSLGDFHCWTVLGSFSLTEGYVLKACFALLLLPILQALLPQTCKYTLQVAEL